MVGESIDIPYPFLMKSLYFKLSTKSEYIEDWATKYRDDIKEIIKGEFKKDDDGIFRFYRNGEKFDLIDIATGIKYFGILQVLLDNKHLNSYSLIVLDEPEVHLHPKWQLEMAKIIVKLVKNGVKVLVTSHSPYMIEALKRYSEVEEIEDKTNFYLTEDGYIKYQESLEDIFEKLALPMRELKELKWQSLKKN
jgi:predicted ATPase